MADNTKLLMLGGAGLAAWWFFFRDGAAPAVANSGQQKMPGVTPEQAAAITAQQVRDAAQSLGPAPGASGPGASPPVSTIAGIQARVLAASGNPPGGMSEDAWGWYLNNELAALGKGPAPDPVPLFGGGPGGPTDRSRNILADEYWPKMEAALRSQLGLNGYRAGLGLYGMGAYLRAN